MWELEKWLKETCESGTGDDGRERRRSRSGIPRQRGSTRRPELTNLMTGRSLVPQTLGQPSRQRLLTPGRPTIG